MNTKEIICPDCGGILQVKLPGNIIITKVIISGGSYNSREFLIFEDTEKKNKYPSNMLQHKTFAIDHKESGKSYNCSYNKIQINFYYDFTQ
jgi:hypothetical protein